MEVNSNGITVTSVLKKLSDKVDKLRELYGKDFFIRPEGVIDNIMTAITFMEHKFIEQIAFFAKQLDSETAEREYQDALYERVGLYRNLASKTTFLKNVFAVSNSTIAKNSITLKHSVTKEEFSNSEEVVVDESGKATIKFESVIEGNIKIAEDDTLEVIEAPTNFYGLGNDKLKDINLGQEEETDSEFRLRFYNIKNNRAKCTRNAIIQSLCDYVDYPQHLKIIDANSDSAIHAGSILIIAKHNTTDEIFAKAILNNVLGGLNFVGNTTVSLPLSNGGNWEVKFQKASEILLEINANIKIKREFYENNVFTNIKNNIEKYVFERAYGLNSSVYATEFIIPILETEGVEAVSSISIKKATDNSYTDHVDLERDEIPLFSKTSIYLTKD